jgi:hypothetical protein
MNGSAVISLPKTAPSCSGCNWAGEKSLEVADSKGEKLLAPPPTPGVFAKESVFA